MIAQGTKAKRAPRKGSAVVWPKGVEERYGISSPTRWRWEKEGKLPPRDFSLGGKTGWRPETLAAAESL
jgi:predicted DNA-binding transcriptional regulator AlpA